MKLGEVIVGAFRIRLPVSNGRNANQVNVIRSRIR
jgi:hypothetical protein